MIYIKCFFRVYKRTQISQNKDTQKNWQAKVLNPKKNPSQKKYLKPKLCKVLVAVRQKPLESDAYTIVK